jgi:hypothetical protein
VIDLEQAFLVGHVDTKELVLQDIVRRVHVVDDLVLTLIFPLFIHIEGWVLRIRRLRRD